MLNAFIVVVKNKGKVKVKEKKEHIRKLKKKRNVPSVVSVDNEEQVAPAVNVQEDNGGIQRYSIYSHVM